LPYSMADESALTKRLESLEGKVRQLVISHEKLKAQLKEANQENETLKVTLKQQGEELKRMASEALQKKPVGNSDRFQNQDKITKIVALTLADKDPTGELKEKLNEYIREIEQCIAQLSQ
jgi:hypothetical protein